MLTALEAYNRLYEFYGPQHWWPAETPFEVMVGAILTQNTSWTNVEKAIVNLKQHCDIHAEHILSLTDETLADILYPVGYYNIKTKRLKNFCRWYDEQGGYETLAGCATQELRNKLLSINGIGPETADDMLLYAFDRDIFVIDAYTKRLFTRLGLVKSRMDYHELQSWFHDEFNSDTNKIEIFNELHALIVIHAKKSCSKKPRCNACCLLGVCSQTGVSRGL